MRASKLVITILVLAVAVGASAGDLERSKVRRAPTAIQASDGPVTTTRDAQGIWFIEGGSLYDVFEAMGYAVATDRLWQIDIFRRTARGRLSEILGPAGVELDVPMRIMGYSNDELAAQFAGLSPDAQTVVQGYVDGINRRVAEFNPVRLWRDMPYEYWLLSIQAVLLQGIGLPVLPTPWEPEDVLAWMTLMGRFFDGEGDWVQNDPAQAENFLLVQTLGAVYGAEGLAMFGDQRWVNDPTALTVVPSNGAKAEKSTRFHVPSVEGVDLDALRDAISNMRAQNDLIQQRLKDFGANIDFGSYAWSMSGDKTASGNPMLYSGPQMGFSAPAVVGEGSIRGGGLEISGMHVPGIPAIIIGRTPHHAWSMQTGHAHTVDFFLEAPETVDFHRMETINVFGGDPVMLPVFRSSHGPIISPMPYNPTAPPDFIFSWAYGPWGHEADNIEAFLDLARAQSMDDFNAGMEDFSLSFHFNYVDRDGNFAYWMSGWDPVRAEGSNPLFPQMGDGSQEWTGEFKPIVNDRNNPRGWYGGWNNKASLASNNGTSNYSYYFGPWHRAHVVDDYLSAHDDLTFEEVRDLALNIATTDSITGGGNTWAFVADAFEAAVAANPSEDRDAAIAMLDAWDRHFVAGGPSEWRFGAYKADAYLLQDWWVGEVLRITFEDEFRVAGMSWEEQPESILYNVLLRALAGQTYYDWFQDKAGTGTKPTGAEAIIVRALDNVIEHAGLGPYNEPRGTISYEHGVLGFVPILGDIYDQTPYSRRSTYAHVVEYDMNGPIKIESMFPLGESGAMYYNGTLSPSFDPNFFSMVPVFDPFMPRPFPLFE